MNLNKVFGLYTVGFLVVTILIGIAEAVFQLPNRYHRLDLHGSLDGHLPAHRHRDPHLRRRPVLRGRPRRPRPLQRHGHRVRLDVGGLLHLHGRRALGAGLLGPGLRHGLDRRLPAPRRLPRPLPAPVRPVHHPRLPGRPLQRQHPAHHRRGGGHHGVVHLPHRAGDRRRPHRLPLHRPRVQRGLLRGAHRRALLLGARRHEGGDLDAGGPVHHPHHLLPGAGGGAVVEDLHHPRAGADLRPAAAAEQRRRHRRSPTTRRRSPPGPSGRRRPRPPRRS